jgi:hypothetical protein
LVCQDFANSASRTLTDIFRKPKLEVEPIRFEPILPSGDHVHNVVSPLFNSKGKTHGQSLLEA